MADPNLPQTRPRTFMGSPVGGPGITDRGPRPRSFFEAAQAEWEFSMEEIVKPRWRMLGEPAGEPLRQEEFQEIVGERNLPFEPGITANEAERRVAFHDYDQAQSRYQGNVLAALVGGGLPMMIDPVSVATLPVGGSAFRAGGQALLRGSWGRFFSQTAIGGAQAGIASLPLELGFQRRETENLRPGELAGTVAGPIIAPLGLGALGAGARSVVRRLRNGRDASRISRNLASSNEVDPATAEAAVRQAEVDGIRPPPASRRTRAEETPTGRLQQMFVDYDGGHRQWVRDLAAGRTTAREHALSLGIDPEDPLIERMLDRLGRESDLRSATPTDYNFRMLDTFNRFRAGDAMDAADLRVLQDNGLALPRAQAGSGHLRVRTPEGQPELAVTSAGRRLAEALDNPKSVSNAQLLRKVNRDGASAVRNELEARAGRNEEGVDIPPTGNRIIDDEFDDATVLRALDGISRSNADDPVDMPAPRRQETADAEGNVTANRVEQDQEVEAFAREHGVNLESIDGRIREALEGAIRCGRQ